MTENTSPTICAVPDCEETTVAFRHFPTVVGYCVLHGNVLADYLALIDAAGPIGFDGTRARWENGVAQRTRQK